MPGKLDGIGVAHHARSIHPGIPVIIVSAFAHNLRERLAELAPPMQFFTKPYQTAEITKALRRHRQ
ncbi:hypothetical protein [Acidisoma cladoniae]|uniref:hypothetical protein n=1 Tax=Acidisoma cladoniae TaxID=3040935 RepID=UPI0033140C29